MSDGPTPIRGRTVIAALREVLAMAERGELRSVAIAYEMADRTAHRIGFGVGSWSTALLGELEAAKLSILVSDGRLTKTGE
jgi:hypothetical protein